MSTFKRDLEYLIEQGAFDLNRGKIKFVFRHANRLRGSIKELELSDRAHNCLMRGKCETIEDVTKNWDELGRIKQCGVKSVKEIKNRYLDFYYGTLENDVERKEFWRDTINATMM